MKRAINPYRELDDLVKENGWSIEEVAQRLRKADAKTFGTLNPSTVFRWLEQRKETPELLRTIERAVKQLRGTARPAPILKVGLFRYGAGLLPGRLLNQHITDPEDPLHLDNFGIAIEQHLLDSANKSIQMLNGESHIALASRNWISASETHSLPFCRLCEMARLPVEAIFRKDKSFDESMLANYTFAVPTGTAYSHNLEAFTSGVTWKKHNIKQEFFESNAHLTLEELKKIDGVIGDPAFVGRINGLYKNFNPLPMLLFGVNYIDIFVSKNPPREITLQTLLSYVRALAQSTRFVNEWIATETSNDSPRVRIKKSSPGTSYYQLFQALAEIFGGNTPMLEVLSILKRYCFHIGALETEVMLGLWSADRDVMTYSGLCEVAQSMTHVPVELLSTLAHRSLNLGMVKDSLKWIAAIKDAPKGKSILNALSKEQRFLLIAEDIQALNS